MATTADPDPNQRKILIAGDVRGKLAALYKRVASVNGSAAGPFDAVFCVGPFFQGRSGENADGDAAAAPVAAAAAFNDELRPYVDGTATAPIPTYFVDGLPDGREFCRDPDGKVAPNVTFLRKPGVFKLHGLRVAVLPGRYNEISYKDASKVAASAAAAEGEYRHDDVQALKAAHFGDGSGVVDLLLTSEWPKGVDAFTRDVAAAQPAAAAASDCLPIRSAAAAGSPVVAELARDLQPRYHAAGRGGVFFAREPYRNPRAHVTRFVGLAPVANKGKQKWLHALGLVPADGMPPTALHQQPPDTTQSPYNLPVNTVAGAGTGAGAGAGDGEEFNHSQVRWEEPKAKKARLAANVDRRPIQGDPDKTVYVKNLAYRADEGALAEFFGQCGDLVDVRLGRMDDGRSRGFCHVAYATAEAAERALQLSESNFFGRDILVQMAETEEARNAKRDAKRAEQRAARRPPPPPPTGCWFCLSNEKDLHLVVSIAGESFVSMDKGGVVADHCQVVPVEHVPSFAAMSPSTATEVFKYIAAVRECFAAGGGGSPVPAAGAAAAGETSDVGGGGGGEGKCSYRSDIPKAEGDEGAAVGEGAEAAAAAAAVGGEKAAEEAGGLGQGSDKGGPRDLVVFERHLALRSKGGNHCHMNCVPVGDSAPEGELGGRRGQKK